MLNTEDRLEIYETLALHAHLLDSDQLDRLDELFTPDAVYDLSASGFGVFTGTEAIRAAAARMSESGYAPLAHLLTNIIVTSSDEDTATAQSKGLLIMSGGAVQAVTQVDALRRTEGGWRISSRVITPPWRSSGAAGDHHGSDATDARTLEQTGAAS